VGICRHNITSLSHLNSSRRFCAVILLKNSRSPDLFPAAASTILGITYGYTPQGANDKFIQLAHKATFETFRYGGPGSSICDLVPFCMFCRFLGVLFWSNKERSEALANVDAIFLLSEACCLHQDDRGEAFQSAARVDRSQDGM
jgi:hypothetical protein